MPLFWLNAIADRGAGIAKSVVADIRLFRRRPYPVFFRCPGRLFQPEAGLFFVFEDVAIEAQRLRQHYANALVVDDLGATDDRHLHSPLRRIRPASDHAYTRRDIGLGESDQFPNVDQYATSAGLKGLTQALIHVVHGLRKRSGALKSITANLVHDARLQHDGITGSECLSCFEKGTLTPILLME